MKTKLESILEKAKSEAIGREEALFLFHETENYSAAEKLFSVAGKVRDKEMGTTFRWSGGIASVLRCNLKPLCLYCPYWLEKLQEPLRIDEILKGVAYIKSQGIKEFHLSAGTTLGSDGKEMVEIVKAIRSNGYTQSITVNCGAALSKESLIELKKLGVERIGCSFETIDENLFRKVKPGDSLEAKRNLAEMTRDVGLEMGTGLLAGLDTSPSRYEGYVDFMFYIKEFSNLKSVYVSRFFPYKGIPMENHPRCSTMEGARIIAIMRLVLRNIDIGPAAGWSYDDIPAWVQAGGGNRVGGVHVNRVPSYRANWFLPKAVQYKDKMEIRNTMEVATKFLNELGIDVQA